MFQKVPPMRMPGNLVISRSRHLATKFTEQHQSLNHRKPAPATRHLLNQKQEDSRTGSSNPIYEHSHAPLWKSPQNIVTAPPQAAEKDRLLTNAPFTGISVTPPGSAQRHTTPNGVC
jgi:hypothetical protein